MKARVAEESDYIKLFIEHGSAARPLPTRSRDEVGAVIAAARAAGKMAIVHVSRLEDAHLAVEEGADGLARMFEDTPADEAFVALARKRHVFITGTLAVLDDESGGHEARDMLADPDVAPLLSPFQRETLSGKFGHVVPSAASYALGSTRRFHRAVVLILAGDDAPNPGTAHGVALIEELDMLERGVHADRQPDRGDLAAREAFPYGRPGRHRSGQSRGPRLGARRPRRQYPGDAADRLDMEERLPG